MKSIIEPAVESPRLVKLAFLMVLDFCVFPVAYITVTQAWAYPELAVLIAYIPLLIVAIKFKAGHADA